MCQYQFNNLRIAKGWLGFVLLLLGSTAHARATDTGSTLQQNINPRRCAVIWGGGEPPQALLNRFAKGARQGPVAVVAGKQRYEQLAHLLRTERDRASVAIEAIAADAPDLAAQLKPFAVVWIDAPTLPPGAIPLDPLVVWHDHYRDVPPDLSATLEKHPGLVGLAIEKETALIATGRHLQAIGRGTVSLSLPASTTRPQARPQLIQTLHDKDEADLVALSRAAIARRGARFPPENGATPEVPHGTLLACGGGDLPEVVWRRFVDLAGGVDAPIVVLPIANRNPEDPAQRGIEALHRLGCRDVTILQQRTRAEVESPTFVEALRRARGVWFAGGRQWKYVDAYEETVAEELFRDVLRRGGVIGGSSAGAAIQGEFLVRGDPLGNRNIIAEGYERGLGFLPRTAIDIHVSQRSRLEEMSQVVTLYPEILGISLDEGIAAEVSGRTMTLLGRGKAFVTTAQAAEPLALAPGDRFELSRREKLP